MTRSSPAQRPPDPTRVTAAFPAQVVRADTLLYRAAGVDAAGAPQHPGWFSSDGAGRFDLHAPQGSLYAARSVHTAVMERVGPVLVSVSFVPPGVAATTWVWTLAPERDLRVADLDDPAAAGAGVTRELSAGGDYAMTQAWAAHFTALGFDGVSYRGRFSTSLLPIDAALALFGPEHAGLGPLRVVAGPKALADVARLARVMIAAPRARHPRPPMVAGH